MPDFKKAWDIKGRKQFIDQDEIDIDVPDGDMERGEEIFNHNCSGCHAIDQNNRGSNIFREIYNNKLGLTANFDLVGGMAEARGLIWTPKTLFLFFENPESLIKDSIMHFHGIKDPYDRACVIEYLHYLRVHTI